MFGTVADGKGSVLDIDILREGRISQQCTNGEKLIRLQRTIASVTGHCHRFGQCKLIQLLAASIGHYHIAGIDMHVLFPTRIDTRRQLGDNAI